MNQIAAALILSEGLVFGLIAFFLFRKKKAKLALCHRTWGDVIEVKEHRSSDSPTKHPVIRYKATNGQDVTFESKYGSSNWQVKAGDRLEILVNPTTPADAEIVGFMAQWGLPTILAVVSVTSIIAAPVAYLMLKTH